MNFSIFYVNDYLPQRLKSSVFSDYFQLAQCFFLHNSLTHQSKTKKKKTSFATVFQHVDDIDLFVGGLAERPLSGAVVGPTFGCLLGQQFQILKKGDRFWFENNIPPSAYSKGMQYSILMQVFMFVKIATFCLCGFFISLFSLIF